ncbi:enoyl-CoA hydratase/isomerase family protein [Haloglomus litoreum]|uniref:enoyl-CoA hydratase/isomerase family protein n=1 Tax=Haloglomus litoreum TaxID=3034026 RepID=UPI0023E8DC80|nr:enoyl-CoA hydratase-related protein [Haloglomus sp. DT116]
MSDRITSMAADGVVTVTMDDPERDNPLRREEYRAMHDAFRAAREGDARCVVLRGAGDAFSSGFDIEGLDPGHLEAPLPERVAAIRANEQALAREILTHPLPTVALVDGPAIGDAAGFALACDIRLASERARIGLSHVRLGLGLDCGLSYTLPRRVGWGTAVDLATTGRIVDGATAAELGLVTRTVPDDAFDERADELVADIAAGPPVALRSIKEALLHGAEADLDAALRDEAFRQAVALDTADHARAVAALGSDERPEFEGR